MEAPAEEDGSSSPNFMYRAAHQAFRDRWKGTDDTMCRHSMSFHLHHTLRSEFFASYLYLVEKIPLGKLHLTGGGFTGCSCALFFFFCGGSADVEMIGYRCRRTPSKINI